MSKVDYRNKVLSINLFQIIF